MTSVTRREFRPLGDLDGGAFLSLSSLVTTSKSLKSKKCTGFATSVMRNLNKRKKATWGNKEQTFGFPFPIHGAFTDKSSPSGKLYLHEEGGIALLRAWLISESVPSLLLYRMKSHASAHPQRPDFLLLFCIHWSRPVYLVQPPMSQQVYCRGGCLWCISPVETSGVFQLIQEKGSCYLQQDRVARYSLHE